MEISCHKKPRQEIEVIEIFENIIECSDPVSKKLVIGFYYTNMEEYYDEPNAVSVNGKGHVGRTLRLKLI